MIRFTYPQGKKRALTFSYDDGQIHDRRLVKIFDRYRLKATFHLNGGKLGQPGFVEADEIKTLYEGHEISAHSLNHPFLNQLCQTELTFEILEDRRILEQKGEQIVRGMSYPFGVYSEEIIESIKPLGMEYSRTVENTGKFYLPRDFMKWHPTCHHNQLNEVMIQDFLNTPEHRTMSLLYVWGHSYEFQDRDNWNHIEHCCQLLSEKDDVWYATNIEIKDYLDAIRRVKTNLAESILYNPSGVSVWVKSVNDEIIEIGPGKTYVK